MVGMSRLSRTCRRPDPARIYSGCRERTHYTLPVCSLGVLVPRREIRLLCFPLPTNPMVYRKISEDLKNRAIILYDQGLIPDDISRLFGISTRSLSRWKDNQLTYGSVIPPPTYRSGRPRILDAEQVLSISEQLERAPELYLDEIQDWVALTMEIVISRSALTELIKDAGFSYKMLHKAAAERDEVARAEFRDWARDYVTADMVVTADESSKNDRTIFRRWGRSMKGTSADVRAGFNRGERYSILAAISVNGYVATRIVIGSVDSQEFFDFIVSDVVRAQSSVLFTHS